jgi:hypothetical protein
MCSAHAGKTIEKQAVNCCLTIFVNLGEPNDPNFAFPVFFIHALFDFKMAGTQRHIIDRTNRSRTIVLAHKSVFF